MIVPSSIDVRWRVVQSLQTELSDLNPGTSWHDDVELAITLALSPGRAAENPAFLRRNVIRDARRIRTRKQHPSLFSELSNASEDGGEGGRAVEDRLRPSTVAQPIEHLVAQELQDDLRAAVSTVPLGSVCLDAKLRGETISETARRLGVPRHRLDYTVSQMRLAADQILERRELQ